MPDKTVIRALVFWLACGAALASELKVAATIPIGSLGSAMALSPDEKELYVVQGDSSTVAIVSTGAWKLVKRIPVGKGPRAVAFSPDGKRAYVGQRPLDLSVIDTGSGKVTPIRLGGPVADLAISADGETLFLAMCWSGLRKLNTRTGAVQMLYSQFCPWGLALSPDQKSLWVAFQGGGPGGRWGHDAVAEFDPATGKLRGAVTGLANVGGGVTISPDSRFVWTEGQDACVARAYDHVGCPAVPAGIVHVIDASQRKAIRAQAKALGGNPVALSRDGSLALLAGAHLLLLDARNFNHLATFSADLTRAVFSGDARRIYAAALKNPEIVVLDVVHVR